MLSILRKSKERVGVDASSLFTRFGGRPLEQDRRQQGRQTDVGDGILRKAAVKTTWGRERMKIVVSFRCSQGTHEETRQFDIFVSQRAGVVLGPFGPF